MQQPQHLATHDGRPRGPGGERGEHGRDEDRRRGQDRRDEAESLLDAVLFGQVTAAPPAADPEPEPDAAPEAEAATVTPPAATERVITEPEEQELPLDLPEQPTPAAAPKPVRRKRASVPSWDEIVFGGPKS